MKRGKWKMNKKDFFKCSVFCITILFLMLHSTSSGLASGDLQFDSEWGYFDSDPDPVDPDPQGFYAPTDIAIHPSGIIYVSDTKNNRIKKYSSNGDFLGVFVECTDEDPMQFDYCKDPWEPNYPTSLAFAPSGDYVYVVNARSYCIQKFDSNGNFVTSWGVLEDIGSGFIKEPAGVAVDAAGDVYVTDIWESLILKFDADGNFITLWPSPYGSGDSFRPTSIAVGPSGIYITDYLNSYVHKLDYAGDFSTSWGGYDGTADGEFTYPTAIAVDSLGNLFLADTLNYRIQSFSGTWESCDGGAAGQINRPFGIATDDSGNVYVADTFNHRILKYTFTMTNIIIDGYDSGVEDQVLNDGSTMRDLIAECAGGTNNHVEFANCVEELTNDWIMAGLITENEKATIINCATNSTIMK